VTRADRPATILLMDRAEVDIAHPITKETTLIFGGTARGGGISNIASCHLTDPSGMDNIVSDRLAGL